MPWIRSQNKPYTRSSLDASARFGNLCCAAVLAFSRGRWGNDTLVTLKKPSTTTDLGLSISRVLSGGGTGGSSGAIRRLFALREPEGDEHLPAGMSCLSMDFYRSVEEVTGMCSGDSSITWATRRVDECDTGHPKYMASYFGFLPTRLIFVPYDAETNGVSLRPRDSVPRDARDARYAALSHCWGPGESWPECQTTAHEYHQHLLGIPWAEVPQTFADAITLTRQLGLEHIWIDSLCIIERNDADWKTESVTMHQVYSNAHVTLAACDVCFKLDYRRWRN